MRKIRIFKKILGGLMVFSPFAGVFTLAVIGYGIGVALGAFVMTIAIALIMILGMFLLVNP
ncbi:MAG: hypothetical protein A3B89_00095 [Candidatus Buchananbacteria bacterium RIFCSPHIGHO2_02_FULL_40_13]|uniref:Uncharacterized protein n=1 Tax=Candidatus Buchananbacteria bacterium RIFCSPLOWO2_01_FULL_39_33 TaxID=1797543 RepID=A0A1G1YLU6_9BACT|nr:MAG: hypothetical protein A2820_01755 [Candidatus Buchananbacteria bacterium RIFCSPHIGHO2_01_FULL_40_35]OGY51176.1 MAG: hypothetical protein A3B89_00095 [Candidatus Buchananbacteria bacterium RIFCSPHIGHO2_02_FULL_40_13]OGY53279.1 MAG: hypothetical protein A3A02_03250 [Candidatus Buchananbacteria bacterium RIFCSPLOWO2_01_FULL_39_33]